MAATEKISITLDRALLTEARQHASGNLSGWIAEAVRERLALERARAFLREREEERGRLPAKMLEEMGPKKLFARHPEARGYLRQDGQLRLFDRRETLVEDLMNQVHKPAQLKRIKKTFDFPLQLVARAAG